MFNKKDVAVCVNDLMIEYSIKLSDSVVMVKQECSEEELRIYKRIIGKLMGWAFCDVMTPIYQQYPDLMPEELKGKDPSTQA
jgi:hypothetical protein